jgi:hypothetical protein
MCLVVLLQTPVAVKTLPGRLLSRDHLYLFSRQVTSWYQSPELALPLPRSTSA